MRQEYRLQSRDDFRNENTEVLPQDATTENSQDRIRPCYKTSMKKK